MLSWSIFVFKSLILSVVHEPINLLLPPGSVVAAEHSKLD